MDLNEHIIVPVFQELVKQKPKLELLLPEDEEEELDIRRLAREIIDGFPWPIAVEFRRLFSPDYDGLSQGRLSQILKIVERITQFMAFVLLAQLLDESYERDLVYPDETFRTHFPSAFKKLTLGNYIWLIDSLTKIFTTNEITPFLPEMHPLLTKRLSTSLQPWCHIRNKISHYLVNLDDEEIQKRCGEFQHNLIKVCADIAFLVKYPLITIMDIHVDKRKRKPAGFIHAMKYLPDFAGKRREYATYTENHAVLLLKSLTDAPSAYLNLSPLIIDTHTEELDTPEKKKNIKMDLFLYSKYVTSGADHVRLYYAGTKIGVEDCDLRSLSCYDQLVEEFQEYFTRFGAGIDHG